LFGSFKRKLDNDEIKVAQLSGYISEHTGYHHGEASLQGAIINMAQDFCGSNNINLLKPNGNFGSRRMGGNDAASARYIFTQLSDITRNVFINKDESILKYNIEEGDVVEPETYYPIIPLILVNGTKGIGTGFSTDIPPHNPLDIIQNIEDLLKGVVSEKLKELQPWYKGFNGIIEKVNDTTYNSYGKYQILNENTVHITELPIGTWTQDYIEFLAGLIEQNSLIQDYENNSGNHKIDIKLKFANSELQKLIKQGILEKKLKLITPIKTSNMHLFKNNVITKYSNANSILKDYAELRLEVYNERKKYYIKVLKNELAILKYRKKFIEQIIDKTIIIEKTKKVDIIQKLVELKYPELSHNIYTKISYDYLTNLPLFSLTLEKIEEINNDHQAKSSELETYKNTTVENLWLSELDELKNVYNKWVVSYDMNNDEPTKKQKSSKKVVKSKVEEVVVKKNKSK
jgi:DNA topoisomerase-2